MGVVKNIGKQARYLSKYLGKGDFERASFSKGWVFPGWIGYSKWVKKIEGSYPPVDMLAELARMTDEVRNRDTWYGLYLDDIR